jgi:hypothetical protein
MVETSTMLCPFFTVCIWMLETRIKWMLESILRCRYIDMAETLCQKRALEAFNLDPEKWGGKNVVCINVSFYVCLAMFCPVALTIAYNISVLILVPFMWTFCWQKILMEAPTVKPLCGPRSYK